MPQPAVDYWSLWGKVCIIQDLNFKWQLYILSINNICNNTNFIYLVYEPEWGGKELLSVNAQSVELLWNDFAHRLAEQVLIPLNTYQVLPRSHPSTLVLFYFTIWGLYLLSLLLYYASYLFERISLLFCLHLNVHAIKLRTCIWIVHIGIARRL